MPTRVIKVDVTCYEIGSVVETPKFRGIIRGINIPHCHHWMKVTRVLKPAETHVNIGDYVKLSFGEGTEVACNAVENAWLIAQKHANTLPNVFRSNRLLVAAD